MREKVHRGQAFQAVARCEPDRIAGERCRVAGDIQEVFRRDLEQGVKSGRRKAAPGRALENDFTQTEEALP